MYDDFMHGPENEEATGEFYPALNLANTHKAYIATIELPGVKKEDVQIAFEEGKLIIQGEKKEEAKAAGSDFLYHEREYGKFFRKISVEGRVKEDKISAEFHDGILEVRLPKERRENSKRVHINIK